MTRMTQGADGLLVRLEGLQRRGSLDWDRYQRLAELDVGDDPVGAPSSGGSCLASTGSSSSASFMLVGRVGS
jgi:hypothetical protein